MTALDPRPTISSDSGADRLAALVEADRRPGTPADKQARALARDPYPWAHPEHTARHIAHHARRRRSCANDTERTQPCDCTALPTVLAEVWAAKARMAVARAAASVPLNDLDRQVLDLGADT